ncbi:MAG: hypothetical protein AB1576_13500 [Bacillota bacterium]|jgi:hypothetical protein
MSVITSYTTRIRLKTGEGQDFRETVGWSLLVDAVEATAESHGGRVVRSISDFFGRVRLCDLALVTPEMPRGVGVEVDEATGEVFFLYDDYGGLEEASRDLAEEISQNFAALAVTRAFESLNYEVEVEEVSSPEGREVLVRGGL